MAVSNNKFAETAVARLHLGIPYRGAPNAEMCDAFVEQTLKAAGGEYKNWAGSNTMYRKAVWDIYPLKDAIKKGVLQPGWVLFIVEHDGGEPEQYRGDGLGNANHIGIYTNMVDPQDGKFVEVVHSSSTRGGVAASTLKNGWTHAAKYSGVSYGTSAEASMEAMITVASSGTSVNLRAEPNLSATVLARIPLGVTVSAVKYNDKWHQVNYSGKSGFIMSEYLSAGTSPSTPVTPAPSGDTITVDRGLLRAIYLELKNMLGE